MSDDHFCVRYGYQQQHNNQQEAKTKRQYEIQFAGNEVVVRYAFLEAPCCWAAVGEVLLERIQCDSTTANRAGTASLHPRGGAV
jgi:hypothetical protein